MVLSFYMYYLALQHVGVERHLVKVIPETRRVH